MKKTGLLLIVGALFAFMPQQTEAFDLGGVPVNPNNPIGFEAGLIKNHDMQMLNQHRFEMEKSREYQAQQRADQQEAELKAKFNTYQSRNEKAPASNMEFMQGKNGSIIIKDAQ